MIQMHEKVYEIVSCIGLSVSLYSTAAHCVEQDSYEVRNCGGGGDGAGGGIHVRARNQTECSMLNR